MAALGGELQVSARLQFIIVRHDQIHMWTVSLYGGGLGYENRLGGHQWSRARPSAHSNIRLHDLSTRRVLRK